MMPESIALIALTERGAALARRLQPRLDRARLYALAHRVDRADESFTETGAHLRALFTAGTTIVAVAAAGIVIRGLAPLLIDKRSEPPVIVVAEDGSAVVPLLGGHRGANALARKIADLLGIAAAITTTGDLRFGLALDDPPPGWRLRNPVAAKPVAAALLAGEPTRLMVEAGDPAWLRQSDLKFADRARLAIHVTDAVVEPGDDALVYHPAVLAIGVGCERGTEPRELRALVDETLARAKLAPEAVALIATIDIKEDEPAMHALADALTVPARFFAADALATESPRVATPSAIVLRETGTPSVAEAAALAAAGPDATLVVTKVKSARATCAIARSPTVIDPHAVGRARGCLSIVGIGPGDAAWRTPEASRVIAEASDLVGYGLYLDLLGAAVIGKQNHRAPLGEEDARARLALDRAAEGRRVALISSGDAGIYGMASLVFELIDREDRAEWRRIEIRVCPGVSALQAAAARIGAPLGHDFAAISLSDLLTPWETIEHRLEAAAAADFVIALYNPASAARRAQLDRARDILLTKRAPETPVILARNLGRTGERVTTIRLDELKVETVDMLTLILVGSSSTRHVRGSRWLYTPRGYSRQLTSKNGPDGRPQ